MGVGMLLPDEREILNYGNTARKYGKRITGGETSQLAGLAYQQTWK